MASSYVNDLRLEEIGSGEQSGTWGDTTNTNLELIAEGLSYGTEAITTNANTHTSTVADGATDPARSMYIEYTGTLDSACTITIAPNTLSRMHFIENGTSGSQNIIIKQGSGATITIPPGDTKAVYLDGAGSGAAVVDAFASLNVVDLKVQDDLTVTDDLVVGGVSSFADGSAGAPSITNTGDLDTGILFPAANSIAFSTAGTQRTLINADGFYDYTGAANDVARFGGPNSGSITIRNDTANQVILHTGTSDALVLGTGGNNDRLTIDAAGAATFSSTLAVTGVLTTTAATVFNGGFASNNASTISKLLKSGTDVGTNSQYLQVGDDTSSRELKFSQYQTQGSRDNAGHKIDASSGFGELALAVGSATKLVIDATGDIILSGTSGSDETNKSFNLQMLSHDTNEQNVNVLQVENEAAFNQISIGGGTSALNAATKILLKTAAIDTVSGVERMSIDSSGNVVFNDSGADADFRVETANSANTLFVEGQSGTGTPSIGINNNDPTKIGTSGTAAMGGAAGPCIHISGDDCQIRMDNQALHADNSGNTIFHIRNNYGLTSASAELSLEGGFITFNTGLSLAEAGRFASSKFLVGKTATGAGNVGSEMRAGASDHAMLATTSGNASPLALNRQAGNGAIVQIYNNNAEKGQISLLGDDNLSVGGTVANHAGVSFATNAILPMAAMSTNNAACDIGANGNRFKQLFASNGTISTSDETLKQDIAGLTSTEMLAAKRLSALFKTFRWKSNVATEGDDARTHTGTIAQDVQAAFSAEGLDAGNYSLFTSGSWWEHDVDVDAVEANEDAGVKATDAYTRTDQYYIESEAPEGSTKKTTLGIRYNELLSFLAAYNEQRFAAIETRLTALEG